MTLKVIDRYSAKWIFLHHDPYLWLFRGLDPSYKYYQWERGLDAPSVYLSVSLDLNEFVNWRVDGFGYLEGSPGGGYRYEVRLIKRSLDKYNWMLNDPLSPARHQFMKLLPIVRN